MSQQQPQPTPQPEPIPDAWRDLRDALVWVAELKHEREREAKAREGEANATTR